MRACPEQWQEWGADLARDGFALLIGARGRAPVAGHEAEDMPRLRAYHMPDRARCPKTRRERLPTTRDGAGAANMGDADVNGLRQTNRDVVLEANTPQPAPRWALLERQLLERQAKACEEFFARYFD